MADAESGVFDGPVGQLTVVPLTERIPNRTMGHVALFGLDGLPFVGGGGAGLTPRGGFSESEEYKKGDYVAGPTAGHNELFYWLATEDHEPGSTPPNFGVPGWAALGLTPAVVQQFATVTSELREDLDEKANLPIQIADLGFDPADQEELDSAVSAAVSSLTQELNNKATKTEVTDGLALKATKTELAARQLAKPELYVKGRGAITAVATLGHSLMAGVALSDPTNNRPTAQLARLTTGLIDADNMAVGGSDLLNASLSSGGWGRLFDKYNMASSATIVPNLLALWSGLNGVANYYSAYSTAGNSADYTREAAISFMRARPGSYKAADHSSFTYSANQWSSGTVNDDIANQKTQITPNVGAVVTESVAMVENGIHVISFIQHAGFGGSKWEVKEGSTVLATLDASNVAYAGYHPSVLRIPLTSGNHTLTITCKGVGASVGYAFMHASWDERKYPPVVLDTLQYKPSSYAGYNNSARVPNDADVDMLNARIRGVAALFDDYVIPVPTDNLIARHLGRLSPADGLHLTDDSSQLPALGYFKALAASPVISYNSL